MNFRKKITICPGVKMNVSKSGVSFTVGGKGISANLGKKGLFLNTCLPGTGLYDRRKLMDFDKVGEKLKNKITGQVAVDTPKAKAKPAAAAPELPAAETVSGGNIRLALGLNGEVIVFDKTGRLIEDPAALEVIRGTADYRQALEKLNAHNAREAAGETDPDDVPFDQIMLLSAEVPTADMYTGEVSLPEVALVQPEPFTEPAPDREAILAALTAEAEEKVQGAFWNVKKKREEYVEENLDAAYDREYAAWLGRKDAFETQQAAWADEQNALIREEYSRRLEQLRRGVGADEAYVEDQIAEWISSIDLPMEFDLEYEYDAAAGVLMVNLDLPEIEEIPDEETVTLASGATKLKAKSQKAIKEEYARCVMGLGVFCASHFFCITPEMERILMSAYTQRRDKKTGNMEDEYIYSVIFERDAFEKDGYQKKDPEDFFNKFKNRMLRLASGDLKKIDPYTAEDL